MGDGMMSSSDEGFGPVPPAIIVAVVAIVGLIVYMCTR